jgi:hypothetical protein
MFIAFLDIFYIIELSGRAVCDGTNKRLGSITLELQPPSKPE